MALSQAQVTHRCLQHQGARQCRYLQIRYVSGQGYTSECAKLLKGKKKDIDDDCQKHIDDCKKNHTDPFQRRAAIGTGGTCAGFLWLPTVVQGYDQKSSGKKP